MGRISEINENLSNKTSKQFQLKIVDEVCLSRNEETPETFFSFFDDKNWKVKLPLSVYESCFSFSKTLSNVNSATKSDGTVYTMNYDLLIKNCVALLLKQREIKIGKTEVSCIEENTYTDTEFSSAINRRFNELAQEAMTHLRFKKILFINDHAKTGKTIIVKKYLKNVEDDDFNKLWWLDFNGGHTDFTQTVVSIANADLKRACYLVLDNLECCEFVCAGKILKFFVELTEEINKRGGNLRLIVIQDSDRKIESDDLKLLTNNDNVSVMDNLVSKSLEREAPGRDYKELIDEQYFNYFYEKEENNIKAFLSEENDKARSAKRLLYQIILLAKYKVRIIINKTSCKDDREAINILLNKLNSIRMHCNGVVEFFSQRVCEALHKNLESYFSPFLKEDDKAAENDILSYYYTVRGGNISCIDIGNILEKVNSDLKSSNINKLIEIINRAKDYSKQITNKVLCNKTNKIFDNHFGQILFAAEAIANFADYHWDCVCAWVKLHNKIKETYYIKGQKLPEIAHSYEKYEETLNDFINASGQKNSYEVFNNNLDKPKYNCLKNQIDVHDVLLSKFSDGGSLSDDDIKLITDCPDWALRDDYFRFALSDVQDCPTKPDIKNFFENYLLALLFEFEVSAPSNQLDFTRIQNLWDKIDSYVSFEQDQDFCYFYPKRVPWVSARMLLAIRKGVDNNVFEINQMSKVNKIRSYLIKYLDKCCIRFNNDGNEYGIWTSGTGLWNGVFETVILCVSAIMDAATTQEERICAKRGCGYLQLRLENYDKESVCGIADELSAYLILKRNEMSRSNIAHFIEDVSDRFFKKLNTVKINDDEFDKNDKSLGYTHIAKTYIDLVKALINVRPTLEDLQADSDNLSSVKDQAEQSEVQDIRLDVEAAEQLRLELNIRYDKLRSRITALLEVNKTYGDVNNSNYITNEKLLGNLYRYQHEIEKYTKMSDVELFENIASAEDLLREIDNVKFK